MSGQTTGLASAPPQPKGPTPGLPPSRPKPSHIRRFSVLAALAVVVLSAAIYLTFRSQTQASATSTGAPATLTAKVVRANFAETLRVSGTTQAVSSFPIIAPRLSGEPGGSLTIVRLLPNGAKVKRGDLLVEFDRQN